MVPFLFVQKSGLHLIIWIETGLFIYLCILPDFRDTVYVFSGSRPICRSVYVHSEENYNYILLCVIYFPNETFIIKRLWYFAFTSVWMFYNTGICNETFIHCWTFFPSLNSKKYDRPSRKTYSIWSITLYIIFSFLFKSAIEYTEPCYRQTKAI